MAADTSETPVQGAPTPWVRLRRGVRLPDDPAARVLLTNALVNSIGTGAFLTGSVLFYTTVVGMSAQQMALGLAIAGGLGFLGTVPGGALTDRWGARRMLVILHGVRALSFGVLAVAHGFPAFLVLVSVIELAQGCSPAANEALVADLFDREDRTKRLALIHAARNVGLSLGAVIGGVAITVGGGPGFRTLAVINGLTFALIALSVARLVRFEHRAKAVKQRSLEDDVEARPARLSTAFVLTALVAGCVMLSDSVLFIALPLWIHDHTQAPLALIGTALVINTLLTAAIQVPVTRLTDPFGRAVRALAPAGLLLAIAYVVFGISGNLGALWASVAVVGGVLVLTVAENLLSACSWQIRYDLSPTAGRAKFLSFFSLGEGLETVYGPPLVTALGVGMGIGGWTILAVLAVVMPLAVAGLAVQTLRGQQRGPMAVAK